MNMVDVVGLRGMEFMAYAAILSTADFELDFQFICCSGIKNRT